MVHESSNRVRGTNDTDSHNSGTYTKDNKNRLLRKPNDSRLNDILFVVSLGYIVSYGPITISSFLRMMGL
ncbi:hypothetical protein TrispH2_008978, partial [Trichoplax sp. H2]